MCGYCDGQLSWSLRILKSTGLSCNYVLVFIDVLPRRDDDGPIR